MKKSLTSLATSINRVNKEIEHREKQVQRAVGKLKVLFKQLQRDYPEAFEALKAEYDRQAKGVEVSEDKA